MKRCAALIMLLMFSLWAAAQTSQWGTSSTQNPQMMVVPGTAGPSTNTGTAVIIAPPSAPLLVTPEVHLATVVPAIGATNATSGNTAGASNATAAIPVPPRVVTTAPQFSTAAATAMQTAAPEAQGASSTSTNAPASSSATPAGTPMVVVNNTTGFDRGVGSGNSVGASANYGVKSLGEIARQNRQHEAGANARVYTNQDIDRISQQPGTQVGGMADAVVGAGNVTEASPQPPSGNMPVVAEPTTNPASSNPGVSQPVPPSNTPPSQSEAIPPSPVGQMQAAGHQPTQMAQANPPADPADQNAQLSSATEQRGALQLPAAASILPIMALVGVLAAGAGLLSK